MASIIKKFMSPRIYLTGFMGAGKSTVGERLAKDLSWEFVDLDRMIEQRSEKNISTLFEEKGEAYFRQLESQCLADCAEKNQVIVALGGGTLLDPQNYRLVLNSGLSIYLQAPLSLLLRRLLGDTDRPLLQNADLDEVTELFQRRLPQYEGCLYQVNTENQSPVEVVQSIQNLIGTDS